MNKREHLAKAAGLKSAFSIGENKTLVTSFGRGNEAVFEKLIEDNEVKIDRKNLDLEFTNATSDFKVRRNSHDNMITASNPHRRSGRDMLDRKEVLEERFFGREFDDNIHIQMIYNIMDIEKILSIHVNNAIYALNNVLNRGKDDDDEDVVGVMHSKDFESFKGNKAEAYEKFCKNIGKSQLAYFGSAFYKMGFDTEKKEKGATERKSEEEIYYILSLLSYIRQAACHGSDWNRTDDEAPTALYTLDAKYDTHYKNNEYRKKAREVLNGFYNTRISALNKSFLDKAKIDLTILFEVYDISDRKRKSDFMRLYYDFLVRKEYKTLGFSIKKLREIIAVDKNKNILDHKYDTVRTRLNRMIDFAIYKYYLDNSDKALKMVEDLRSCVSDEEKEKRYAAEVDALWREIKYTVNKGILRKVSAYNIANMRADKFISEKTVAELETEQWKPIDGKAHQFIKLVYLLTLFLDGKEINDLVTTLINKTENIASFNEVLKQLGYELDYSEEYSVFAASDEMASQLRALNSFARMEKPDASAKRIMFVEAARMLGDDGSYEELKAYFDDILAKKSNKEFDAATDNEAIRATDKKKKGFRNFIINNVIESDRFKYLIRYCNVESVQAFSKNRKLVKFVLKDIPESQILRYYNSCKGKSYTEYSADMIDELAGIIHDMTFKQFENVDQSAKRGTPEAADKQQKQNVIRLYLTVCYLFFKNLIYVNSRYFLAFYCLERDVKLWGKTPKFGSREEDTSYTVLTREFMDSGKISTKSKSKNAAESPDEAAKHIPRNYIQKNLDNSDDVAIRYFRNAAEHINALQCAANYLENVEDTESYYGIYHYIMQRYIMQSYSQDKSDGKYDKADARDINDKTKEYFELVENHNTYCKDFVKALCVPFAYNLARFKNLSIDGLFDKNDTREKRNIGTDD